MWLGKGIISSYTNGESIISITSCECLFKILLFSFVLKIKYPRGSFKFFVYFTFVFLKNNNYKSWSCIHFLFVRLIKLLSQIPKWLDGAMFLHNFSIRLLISSLQNSLYIVIELYFKFLMKNYSLGWLHFNIYIKIVINHNFQSLIIY